VKTQRFFLLSLLLAAVFNGPALQKILSDFGIEPRGSSLQADVTVKQYMMTFLSL